MYKILNFSPAGGEKSLFLTERGPGARKPGPRPACAESFLKIAAERMVPAGFFSRRKK